MRIQEMFTYSRALILVVFTGVIAAGCSSTSERSKMRISSNTSTSSLSFRLIDAREIDTLVYSKEGDTQYFGDNNFEVVPVQIIAARFNDKLGDLLKGREVTLLHFRARITDPEPQTYGMPIGTAIIGSALKLPQLGYPHYAGVSLRGSYQKKEFTGDSSVEFYLGSGESEVSEAFDAAVNNAAEKLKSLLIEEHHTPN